MEDDKPDNQQGDKQIESMKDLCWVQLPNGFSSLQQVSHQEENSIKPKAVIPKTKEAKEKKVFDNSVKYKPDKIVLTEWGVGKITSVSNETRTCKLKIEGDEVDFDFDSINTLIKIFFCVLTKTKTEWVSLKFNLDETVEAIRRKLSRIYNCHPSQILLIHSGEKLTSFNKRLADLGLFEGDEMLSVVKDPEEYSYSIYTSSKRMNLAIGFNSVFFHVNENVLLTGVQFYRNEIVDVMCDLVISEINEEGQEATTVLYQVFNILIKSFDPSEEDSNTLKVVFPSISIKKGKAYEIKQHLNTPLVNQCIGSHLNDGKDSANGIKVAFFETEEKYLQKKSNDNSTQTLLAGIFYLIQGETSMP